MTPLGLQEYPDPNDRRSGDDRRAFIFAPSPGGKRDPVEWLKFLIPLVLSALVAYFTANGAIREEVASVKTKEEAHFEEVLRRLDLIQKWQDRQDGKHP